jgi:hypothetical protein
LSLVELARFGSHIDADLARLMLEDEGIEAVIFDGQANSFYGGFGLIPVRLMVLDVDYDEAQTLLIADAKGGARPARG